MRNQLWTYMYHGEVLCHSNIMKCINDTYEGHIVWQVDYHDRVIYLTD